MMLQLVKVSSLSLLHPPQHHSGEYRFAIIKECSRGSRLSGVRLADQSRLAAELLPCCCLPLLTELSIDGSNSDGDGVARLAQYLGWKCMLLMVEGVLNSRQCRKLGAGSWHVISHRNFRAL